MGGSETLRGSSLLHATSGARGEDPSAKLVISFTISFFISVLFVFMPAGLAWNARMA
jgi:hypothetical protein